MSDKALLVIDVQNDFCAGGALEVRDADSVVPVLNKYAQDFKSANLAVYASRDWHPKMTHHFKDYGGTWPPHCIQDTKGAEFHPGLELPQDTEIISAGTDPNEEGYSSFEGRNEDDISLEESLRERGVIHLYIGGIATDYCVKETVIDALNRGFRATLLLDAIRGVDLEPDDSKHAIEEMTSAGARLARVKDVESELLGAEVKT